MISRSSAKRSRLPFPPYSQRMLAAIRRGDYLNTFIMAGPDAWKRHKIRVDRIVLPPESSPDDYDWSLFRGLSPTVIGSTADPERLKRLAWLLLRAGAVLVCVLYYEGPVTRAAFFRNE